MVWQSDRGAHSTHRRGCDESVDDCRRLTRSGFLERSIVVFSGDGRVIGRIGREGRGPGEYLAPSIGVNAGRLIVHDAQLRRLSAFSSEGRLLWTRSGTCCGLHKVGIDRMTRIHVLSRPLVLSVEVPRATLLVFDSLGTLIDSTSVPNAVPGRQYQWSKTSSEAAIAVPVPYSPAPHFAVTGGGSVLFGYSNEYAVYVGKNARDARVVVRRAWTPATLGDTCANAPLTRLLTSSDPSLAGNKQLTCSKPRTFPKRVKRSTVWTSMHAVGWGCFARHPNNGRQASTCTIRHSTTWTSRRDCR